MSKTPSAAQIKEAKQAGYSIKLIAGYCIYTKLAQGTAKAFEVAKKAKANVDRRLA